MKHTASAASVPSSATGYHACALARVDAMEKAGQLSPDNAKAARDTITTDFVSLNSRCSFHRRAISWLRIRKPRRKRSEVGVADKRVRK